MSSVSFDLDLLSFPWFQPIPEPFLIWFISLGVVGQLSDFSDTPPRLFSIPYDIMIRQDVIVVHALLRTHDFTLVFISCHVPRATSINGRMTCCLSLPLAAFALVLCSYDSKGQ